MPILDNETTVTGYGTDVLSLVRRNIGGYYDGILSCEFVSNSAFGVYEVAVNTFTIYGGEFTVATGVFPVAQSSISMKVYGSFTDLKIDIYHPQGGSFDPDCVMNLYKSQPGDSAADILVSTIGGRDYESQAKNVGAIVPPSTILDAPRRVILNGLPTAGRIFGPNMGNNVIPSGSFPAVAMPKMIAGVRPSDTIVVSIGVEMSGAPSSGDSFSVDAYGFYIRHDYGEPWKIGLSRQMANVVYSSTNNPSGAASVSGSFFGRALTSAAVNGTTLTDVLIGGCAINMMILQGAYYMGTNGINTIITEVSSDLRGISSPTGTNTLSYGPGTTTTLDSSSPGATSAIRTALISTTPRLIGGNPVQYDANKTNYNVKLVITNTNASLYVDVGLPSFVYAGTVYGKMNTMAVPALTLIADGASGSVDAEIREFNVAIVDNPGTPGPVRVSAVNSYGFNQPATITKVTVTQASQPSTIISAMGVPYKDSFMPAVVPQFVLYGVSVTGRHVKGQTFIAVPDNVIGIRNMTSSSFPNLVGADNGQSGNGYEYIDVGKGIVCTPYCVYAVLTNYRAIGDYYVTWSLYV